MLPIVKMWPIMVKGLPIGAMRRWPVGIKKKNNKNMKTKKKEKEKRKKGNKVSKVQTMKPANSDIPDEQHGEGVDNVPQNSAGGDQQPSLNSLGKNIVMMLRLDLQQMAHALAML